MKEQANITDIKNLIEQKAIKLNFNELFFKSSDAMFSLPEQEEYYALMHNEVVPNPNLTIDEINDILHEVNTKIANAYITIEVLAKKKIYKSKIFNLFKCECDALLTLTGKCSEFMELLEIIDRK